jgi:hypothetical protein
MSGLAYVFGSRLVTKPGWFVSPGSARKADAKGNLHFQTHFTGAIK